MTKIPEQLEGRLGLSHVQFSIQSFSNQLTMRRKDKVQLIPNSPSNWILSDILVSNETYYSF